MCLFLFTHPRSPDFNCIYSLTFPQLLIRHTSSDHHAPEYLLTQGLHSGFMGYSSVDIKFATSVLQADCYAV